MILNLDTDGIVSDFFQAKELKKRLINRKQRALQKQNAVVSTQPVSIVVTVSLYRVEIFWVICHRVESSLETSPNGTHTNHVNGCVWLESS